MKTNKTVHILAVITALSVALNLFMFGYAYMGTRPGDMDGDGDVDEDDVIYLLQHVLMPEDFPLVPEGSELPEETTKPEETDPAAPIAYTVTFKDWDGAVLKTETVESGKSATAPANPTRTGYVFAGWDKPFANITSDLIVTATYTQNTNPTVTIGNVTGTVGDEVTVTFDLVNSPRLYAMSLKIAFDDTALTLFSAESGEAMDDFTYTNPSRLRSGSNFMWYANDPYEANGTVLKLTFKINVGTPVGTYPITMTCDPSNTYDANDNDVDLEFVNGSILVTG